MSVDIEMVARRLRQSHVRALVAVYYNALWFAGHVSFRQVESLQTWGIFERNSMTFTSAGRAAVERLMVHKRTAGTFDEVDALLTQEIDRRTR